MAEQPAPPAILHVHAAVYVIWLVLVSVQIFLVETGDIRRHKTLGWWTAIVSAVMVPLGLTAAFVDQARQVGTPDYALAIPVAGIRRDDQLLDVHHRRNCCGARRSPPTSG